MDKEEIDAKTDVLDDYGFFDRDKYINQVIKIHKRLCK